MFMFPFILLSCRAINLNTKETGNHMAKFTLLLHVLLFLLFMGCGKEDIPINQGGNGNGDKNEKPSITLEVSPASLHFDAEGGSQDLTVTTNAKSWTISSDQPWCQVKKGETTITVTAIENNAFVPPEKATLRVTAEGTDKQIIIEVTQDAAKVPEEDYIALTTNRAIFHDNGGYQGIGVTTNVAGWHCNSDQPWCVVSKTSDEGVSISIEEHWPGTAPRKATVLFYLKEEEPLATLTVYQDPPPELQLFSSQGNTNIRLPSYGGSITLTVLTNVTEFTLGYAGSWLTVEKINDTQFTISSTPNNGSTMRPDQEVIVYASRISNKLNIFEEEEEASSKNDDHQYSDPTGWD